MRLPQEWITIMSLLYKHHKVCWKIWIHLVPCSLSCSACYNISPPYS